MSTGDVVDLTGSPSNGANANETSTQSNQPHSDTRHVKLGVTAPASKWMNSRQTNGNSEKPPLKKPLHHLKYGTNLQKQGKSTSGAKKRSYSSARKSFTVPTSKKSGDIVTKKPRSSLQGGSIFGGKSTVKTHERKKASYIKRVNTNRVESDVTLSAEQMEVYKKCVDEGESIFFTGAAGTGKTELLRAIIRGLQKKFGGSDVAVTASTGLAACSINGTTLHSFAGIGLGECDAEELIAIVLNNDRTTKRWQSTRVLIVDEISMISGALFDKIEQVARAVRGKVGTFNKEKSFGGLQVIVTGDFLQLPPISSKGESVAYTFESRAWRAVIRSEMLLTHIFRQENDANFSDMLNELRYGDVSDTTERALRLRINVPLDAPTRLYPHRATVDKYNLRELDKVKNEEVEFQAMDQYVADKWMRTLANNCPARECIRLKIGAFVMLLKNLSISEGLVNGSQGTVIDFEEDSGYPMVRFNNGITRILKPEEWTLEQNGKHMAVRVQIPLALAWALSIHKSQGMTIDEVVVCVNRTFTAGQTYVALSRARCLAGLSLEGTFDRTNVRADPRVCQFYRRLKRIALPEGTENVVRSTTTATSTTTTTTPATTAMSSPTKASGSFNAPFVVDDDVAEAALAVAREEAKKLREASFDDDW